ncbi:MAG TPA: LysR substrate-binding domain-containing protein [Woeseiaceae bacterium]|nr:LysR substrate-binding domain-containing protein [Woeseiaceae bacterium]
MLSRRRFPSLPSIRAFEAAARLGGFARAAEELDTTAASVSYHVRRLEEQLGVRLFVRHAKRVELTEAGRVVAREATAAFDTLRASFIRASDIDASRLALTTLPSLGTSWLTPRLGAFRARHPEIVVELELSPEPQDLAGGRFDAAIRNGDGDWPGLRTVELFPSLFLPLCAPPLLDAARIALADPGKASDAPLLGRPDWWEIWHRARGSARVPPPERFGTTLSAEYLDIAAAVAGHGIAIGSPILFRAELDTGRLVPVHDLAASDGRRFWFACPVARDGSRKIVQFREWLCDEAADARHAARAYLRTLAPGG